MRWAEGSSQFRVRAEIPERQCFGPPSEILAIQTRSPGLADSSWPSFRHGNRGTAWLVPGTPANNTPPGAAIGDAINAPVEMGSRD